MDIPSTSLTALFIIWVYRQDIKNDNWIYKNKSVLWIFI